MGLSCLGCLFIVGYRGSGAAEYVSVRIVPRSKASWGPEQKGLRGGWEEGDEKRYKWLGVLLNRVSVKDWALKGE